MDNKRLSYLLEQFFQKTLIHSEQVELNELLSRLDIDTPLEDWMREKWLQYQTNDSLSTEEADRYFQNISAATESDDEQGKKRGILSHFPFLHGNWAKVAAMLVVAVGGYLLYLAIEKDGSPTSSVQETLAAVREDVEPGGSFATLTLGDGSKVVLDSMSNGLIANQGNARIVKLGNGEIKYENGKPTDNVVYNTMSTPIGGEYHLVLPDGTGIWLNAASSITYPTAFTGTERNVSITGEVYFEVAKNAAKPFKVKVGDQLIEVLGTHFNVNAYGDEQTLNTTLVEGKVKVTGADKTMFLQPGQQVQNDKSGNLKLVKDPDLEETLAWKDGLFRFNGTNIETIMRNVSRWYGVEVVYKDKIQEQFVADIPRNVNVSKLLELLELTKQVRFTVNNKVITVTK